MPSLVSICRIVVLFERGHYGSFTLTAGSDFARLCLIDRLWKLMKKLDYMRGECLRLIVWSLSRRVRLASLCPSAAYFCCLSLLLSIFTQCIAVGEEVPMQRSGHENAGRLGDEVSFAMRAFVDARTVPGVTCAVVDGDRTRYEGAIGWRTVNRVDPLEGNEIYWLASVTKPMAATAFMMLVDEGAVGLDDPVSKYLPEFEDVQLADGTAAVVTVRHCMTHTSGLSADRSARITTLADSVKHMASRPLDFEPGTQWKYSRSLDVLGRVAEVVTKLPFDEYMATRLFEPLVMTDTGFNIRKADVPRVVPPTVLNAETGGLEESQTDLISFDGKTENWPSPSFAAFSTVGDLTRFAQFILNRGKVGDRTLLSERAFEEMMTLQTGSLTTGWTPGNGWGLGWCLVRYPQHVTRTLSPGSYGHGGVYGPQLWIDPELGVAYILLFERKDIGNSDGSDLREVLQVTAGRVLHQGNSKGKK